MISPEDLPPQAEMTQLESLAAGAALLAQGLAFQHGDPNIEAANDLANKIVDVITGQHELRQKAAAMKQGRHVRQSRLENNLCQMCGESNETCPGHRGADYVKEEFNRGPISGTLTE